MTAEEIDAQERASFVRWRQKLAALEEEEHLVLTPFEKNLEVWRQLWRVLERSHIVVQVCDPSSDYLMRNPREPPDRLKKSARIKLRWQNIPPDTVWNCLFHTPGHMHICSTQHR